MDDKVPPAIVRATLQAGTAILDGAPVVFIECALLEIRHVLSISQALQLGLELIRQTEHAMTNTVMQRTLVEKGMSMEEATALAQAFQDERKKLLVEQIDEGLKKEFANEAKAE